jgi:hypothetical protein
MSHPPGFGIAVAVTAAISFAIGVSTFFMVKGYVAPLLLIVETVA